MANIEKLSIGIVLNRDLVMGMVGKKYSKQKNIYNILY